MKYNKDDIVEGTVTGTTKYGIFVNLDEYYRGLIHISEISDDFVSDISNYVNIGETIRVRVLSSNDEEYHVNLSIKNMDYRMEHDKPKIIETGSGFGILKDNLDKWISGSYKEKM